MYGDPVPGYRAPEQGPGKEAERRACAGLLALVADTWPGAAPGATPDTSYAWDDFAPGFVRHAREDFPGLPPAALALTPRVRGRMHGLLALEHYGHLGGLVRDPGKVCEEEMRALVASRGLGAPPGLGG